MTIHLNNPSPAGDGAGYTTDTSNLVPYIGATSDLLLSTKRLSATGITSGTLQGILIGTGGSLQAIGSTGVVGQFLYVSGGNTYAFANTAAQAGLGTDVVIPYIGAVSDVNLGNYKLTANALTCGTLQGLLMGTGGSLKVIGTTGVVGQFLYVSGGNTYAWANTSAAGGLGTDIVIPYLGAVSDVLLGNYKLSANAVTCGTLQGVVVGTGGSLTAIGTGATGAFFYHAGNNTYAYANTQASLPTITTGKVGTLLPLTTDTTRYVLGGALELSLNTANIWATTFSGTNFYGGTHSGGTFLASAITCGTLKGILMGTGGSLQTIGTTGNVGEFLYVSGANTYAWANTAAQAGLGTDVVVPYLGAVSDLNLGSYDIFADVISANTIKASTLSSTTLNASIISGGTLRATAITCGTLQGLLMGTGGTVQAIASTGVVGNFLTVSGGNVYAWANTAASLPTVTTGIISGLLPITTDNTRYVLGGTLQLSLNTANIWATTFSGTNFYGGTHSGGTFFATTYSGTTVLVTTTSATTSYATTGSFSTLRATTLSGGTLIASGITAGTLQGVVFGTGGAFSAVATGAVGTFLTHSGANVYAWANTAAQAGLGTDVIVPYIGAVSNMNLGSYAITANAFSSTSTGVSVFSSTLTFLGICSGATLQATTVTCSSFYSTSTSVVYSAASPIMTVAGQVGVDVTTTSGSAFRFFSNAQYCLPAYQSKSFTIVNPAGAATYGIWRTPYAYTLQTVYALCAGGTVTGALYEADGNGANCLTSTINAAITGTTTTASNIVNGGIDSGDFLCWITTSTGGTPTRLDVTYNYTVEPNT